MRLAWDSTNFAARLILLERKIAAGNNLMPQAPRITLHPVSQRMQVHVEGKLIADSTQALKLRETGYPPRHYFPREDVRTDLLTTSETPSVSLVVRLAISPKSNPEGAAWSPCATLFCRA